MSNTSFTPPSGPSGWPFREDVEVSGHVLDSLLLPKILDIINRDGGTFQIKQINIGQQRTDPSYALLEVRAESEQRLSEILDEIGDHGAVPVADRDCRLVTADLDGCFPEGFYSTTNQRTEVRLGGRWVGVDLQEMDCGIRVTSTADNSSADPGSDGAAAESSAPGSSAPGSSAPGSSAPGSSAPGSSAPGSLAKDAFLQASCVAMTDVQAGDQIVVGHAGVRVIPEQRDRDERRLFEFMGSAVSTEKPKGVLIRQVAHELVRAHRGEGQVLVVGGPAIVHTGSAPYLCRLIREGYIDKLFAGNALATHDIEGALFGTSLGIHLDHGHAADHGHEHHLRTINRIRRCGGIQQSVEQGVLTQGIMYECVKQNIPFLLAGSIRDDGPLPEVITDAVEAQRQMRQAIRGVSFCLMIATTLHSVAVGNLLPGWVKVVCVDINPSTVIKLSDRGSIQTVGLVTDVEPFLRVLVDEVEELAAHER